MKYIMGDLIKLADDGHFDILIHGCNAFTTMSGGIAATISRRAPHVYHADCQTKKGDRSKMGTYTEAVVCDTFSVGGYTVINAYTQYTFWDTSDMLDYNALERVFKAIKDDYDSGDDIPRIGIPLIGAGLACGDWDEIEAIIKRIGLRNLTIVVFNDVELKKVNRVIT